jgi:hypothetical protein
MLISCESQGLPVIYKSIERGWGKLHVRALRKPMCFGVIAVSCQDSY